MSRKPQSRKSQSRKPRNSNARKTFAALALVAAVGLLAIAAVQMLGDDKKPAKNTAAATETNPAYAQLAKMARRDAHDPLALGRADAPVVLVEYSDFQCPFCKVFATKVEPRLIADYVDQGVLRIEWRSMAIFGAESEDASRAAWAAGQQGKFWEYHRALFEHAPEKKNTGAFTRDKLVELAGAAGVPDVGKFRADLESPAATAAVRSDVNEGIGIGVNSTPAFLVNGRPILGAQPLEQFRATIDAAAKAAERDSE
ncbi:disulfide bond formation protein DsbA [Nocardia yunnanensis]|uniref:Disulfide bond formation protein DsbA n=1 Tax=Nocardia yunnanensis TaxID=2382165 RepID=A0A386Z717_9NOCA|nr:thioredoxin domain-containing protein [Nocardia yunnanensis]AYF73562.1 disulfide bond formation protein DsbA [Nocardia yunnanensis]